MTRNTKPGKRPKRGGALTREDKQRAWDQKRAEFKKTTDKLGAEIEDGIIETVVALNLLGFPTSQSCEGHPDRGIAAPWVMISLPNQPKRWVNEDKIRADIARKHGLKDAYLLGDQEPTQAHRDAWEEESKVFEKTPETPEFKKWQRQNKNLESKFRKLLDEFYSKQDVQGPARLQIESGSDYFSVHNGGEDYEKSKFGDELSVQDKKGLPGRLAKYKTEMQRFTEFLKDKYFQ